MRWGVGGTCQNSSVPVGVTTQLLECKLEASIKMSTCVCECVRVPEFVGVFIFCSRFFNQLVDSYDSWYENSANAGHSIFVRIL
jgi:hypothetical protein